MKITVPFIKSKVETDCGLVAPMMVYKYFGKKYSFNKISKETKQLESGMVWSLGIARASLKLGYKTKFISTTNFSHETDDLEYYKKYSNDKSMLVLKDLQNEVKELKLSQEERNMPLEELLSLVTKDSIPIVLINWYVISGKEEFSGHFVPITGYDKKFVYIHNPGLAQAQAFMPIEKSLFQKAWESKGTDKDTIIIFRK